MSAENQGETRLEKLRELLKKAANLVSDGNEESHHEAQMTVLEKLKDVWNELGETMDEKYSSGSMEEFLTELKVLETTNSFLGKCIREFRITGGRKFSFDDYAAKLRSKLTKSDGSIDWTMLTGNAIRIINRAPGIPVLLGTFDVTIAEISPKKNRNKKQKVVRPESDVERRETKKELPDKIQSMEVDENSVDSKVEYIMKILHHYCNKNNGNPISFYKFVLHPFNFTTTVENIFHLSFIIRDGLARLDTVEDEIVIEPVVNEMKQSDNGGIALCSKYQMVFSISFDDWKNLVKVYDIREPLIE